MSLVTSMSHSSTTTSRSVCHSSKACQLHHRPRHVASRSLPPHIIDTAAHTTVAVLPANTIADLASAAPSTAEAAAQVPVAVSTYTPGPVEVGWQIWFAAAVSTVPFVIGAYEFGKRIVIQRRCKVCGGNGLVQKGKYQRKCPECGGFFPWISWRHFLSANARPGNGGPLLQPQGQTSIFYTVTPAQPDAGASSDSSSSSHGGAGSNGSTQPPTTANAASQHHGGAGRM